MKQVMRVFSVILLLMVGTAFATGPASLIAMLTPSALNQNFWLVVVLVYYFLATLLPVDKLIGKLYPLFGICLIVMCIGVGVGIAVKGYAIPELRFGDIHPNGLPPWPFMFITVACGAVSGFHATQSPMMARCLTTERYGRRIFYGAMITEGIIAMVWAAAGVAFYGSTGGLMNALSDPNIGANGAIYQICVSVLGPAGGILAMIGVVACPITSGDTAFRSARLTVADWFKIDQKSAKARLMLTIPILAFGAVVGGFVNYSVIWRYFSWSNQTLAAIVLWIAAAYLAKNHGFTHVMASLPAAFITAVSVTYFFAAPECLGLMNKGMIHIAYWIGAIAAAAIYAAFVLFNRSRQTN
jgi:carbon starvation protein CstA